MLSPEEFDRRYPVVEAINNEVYRSVGGTIVEIYPLWRSIRILYFLTRIRSPYIISPLHYTHEKAAFLECEAVDPARSDVRLLIFNALCGLEFLHSIGIYYGSVSINGDSTLKLIPRNGSPFPVLTTSYYFTIGLYGTFTSDTISNNRTIYDHTGEVLHFGRNLWEAGIHLPIVNRMCQTHPEASVLLQDSYFAGMNKEISTFIAPRPLMIQDHADRRWKILIDWVNEVFGSEYSLTPFIINRTQMLLWRLFPSFIERYREMQLLATVCMEIIALLNNSTLDVDYLVYLCAGAYTRTQFDALFKEIIIRLQYDFL